MCGLMRTHDVVTQCRYTIWICSQKLLYIQIFSTVVQWKGEVWYLHPHTLEDIAILNNSKSKDCLRRKEVFSHNAAKDWRLILHQFEQASIETRA